MNQHVKQNSFLKFQFLAKKGILIKQDCMIMCMYSF